MADKLTSLLNRIRSLFVKARVAFDVRDFLFFGGLSLTGYGFWLLKPWVGFVVSGILLMATGYLMRGKQE
jgi:hypothetical protein